MSIQFAERCGIVVTPSIAHQRSQSSKEMNKLDPNKSEKAKKNNYEVAAQVRSQQSSQYKASSISDNISGQETMGLH